MIESFILFFLFFMWLYVTIVMASTGLSSAYRSFQLTIREEDSRHPPGLFLFFVSYEAVEKNGRTRLRFSYPVRIALAMYDVIFDTILMTLIAGLWPAGLLLVIIPYVCNFIYKIGRSRLPIFRHFEENDSADLLSADKKAE